MALTTEQFQTWLESSTAIRCLLVEVVVNIEGIETLMYLSNRNYNTGPSESPANTHYQPYIQTSLSFNQSLPLSGTASLSYGDIAIDNTNGDRDAWLNYVWANREINIYIGDIIHARADFTKIYSGYVADIASSGRNTLNLSIRDMLQVLNTTVTSTLIGGSGTNKEQLRPLVFGEVHNITPVVFDQANLVYMVHNGPIERIIEVRDNGMPLALGVGYTVDLALGTFTLLHPAAGTITCSVQGEKTSINLTTGALITNTYTNTIAKMIGVIIQKYGTSPVLPANIDLVTFSAFDATNVAPAGIYLVSNTNVISLCQDLANSLGAQFTSNRNGLITLLKIDNPLGDTNSKSITDIDILQGSVSIDQKVPVQGSVKLGFCKNWTVQTQLLTGIPPEHKAILASEYLTATSLDANVLSKYNLSDEPQIRNTYLISNSPVSYVANETNRLLALWSTPRFIYKMECTAKFLTLNLGEVIKLTHARFGLSTTKYGQVISISVNWDTGRVSLGILV